MASLALVTLCLGTVATTLCSPTGYVGIPVAQLAIWGHRLWLRWGSLCQKGPLKGHCF